MKRQRSAEILRYRELPGYPEEFVDYTEQVDSARAILPFRPDADSLRRLVRTVRERTYPREDLCGLLAIQASDSKNSASLTSIEKLRETETVAITARLAPGLFGGSFGALLSAITAIKLAHSLEDQGLPAVPLIWIDPSRLHGAEDLTIRFSGQDAREQLLSIQARINAESAEASGPQVPEGIGHLLSRVLECCPDRGRTDGFLELLADTYAPGTPLTSAFAGLLGSVTSPWGPILLDAGDRRFQDLLMAARDGSRAPASSEGGLDRRLSGVTAHGVLPAAVRVIEPDEFSEMVEEAPLFRELGIPLPLIWPRVSCTVMDPRSDKVLQRYGRSLRDLFGGPDEVLEGLTQERLMPDTVLRFERLEDAIRQRLSRLSSALPPEDRALEEVIESSRSKMLYQVGKLKEKYTAAEAFRRETMARQIEKTCSHLAPGGSLQERIATVQMLLRHSPEFPRLLLERIDVYRMEHQIVFLE